LKQIASNPEITQAELAQRCELSVAMVNNYMKELCSSGLLEYRRKSSKDISYHLTVAGREAADATQRELLQELVGFFADAKERVRRAILSQADGKLGRIVLYGTGDLAELVFHALESADVSIVGVCDDDPAVIGHDWCGREVLNPSQIRFVAPDSVIIATFVRTEEICISLRPLQDRGIHLIRLDGLCINGSTPKATAPGGLSGEINLTPRNRAS
jgi:predicted transcriptional regulator